MELQNAMEARRSIRKYDASQKVTKEQLEAMVQAAIYAPTWKNSQTGRYYVACSEEAFSKVKNALHPGNQLKVEGASALIVTTLVANRSGYERDGSATNELDHNEWGVYDLGLANQNLLLKATELGLGTLVMGIRDAAEIRKQLDIPETEIIMAVISVGYPAEAPAMPKRKAVEDVAKFL